MRCPSPHLAAIAGFLLAIHTGTELSAQSAAPSPAQQEALGALSRTGDWYVRWDEETKSPATIQEQRLSVGAAFRRQRPFSPESVATSFLRRHAGLFPLRAGHDSLVIVQVRSTPPPTRRRRGQTHTVRMNQLYESLLVENGGYALTMSPDGKVLFVNGRLYGGIEVDPRPTIGAEEGARIALAEVAAGADSVEHSPTLVVKRRNGRDHLIWEVLVPEGSWNRWVVHVDAHDGRVLSRDNGVIINLR